MNISTSTEPDHRLLQTHRYGVMDRAVLDEVPSDIPLRILAPSFLGEDTDRCPALIDFQAMPSAQLSDLLQTLSDSAVQGEPLLISLHLQSQAEPERLHEHCLHRMVRKLNGADKPKQMRYYDPPILAHLPTILGEAGMSWLMGPIDAMTYWHLGAWHTIHKPDAADPTAFFHFTEEQTQALLRLSAVLRVLVQLPVPTNQTDWLKVGARVDAHVLRAQAHGLAQREEWIAFALHAERVHARFDTHPILQVVFTQLRAASPEDELDYLEMTGQLSPEQWQRIQHESPQEF